MLVRAQSPRPELEKMAKNAVDVVHMNLSPNGQYAVMTETDEDSNVTIVIAETKKPFKVIRKTKVSKYFFLNENEIIFLYGSVLTSLHIPSGKERTISNIRNSEFIDESKLLLVHYDDTKNNSLEIFDSKFILQQHIDSVARWQKTEDEIIVFQNKGSERNLLKVHTTGKSFAKIWSSKEDVNNVTKSNVGSEEYIITVNTVDGLKAYYLTKEKNIVELDDPSTKGFTSIMIKKSSDRNSVMMTLSKRVREDQKVVSIWYGSKVDLSDYFYGEVVSSDILWYPKGNRVLKLDSNYSGYTAVGKSNLFLRKKINKDKVDINDSAHKVNQDEIHLWDSRTDKDLILEGVGDSMYFDKEGNFVLSYAQNKWKLLDTDSMMARIIDMPEGAVPYFTLLNTIVWTIKGEVWEQNILSLKKKRLLLVDADHIEILNRVSKLTEVGNDRKHFYVNDNYLLLSCKTGNELKSSFLILKNGKKSIVIPETTDRIKHFTYDENSKKIVWLAENYNKAPMVLVKKDSEASNIVYATNVDDVTVDRIIKKQLHYKGVDNEDLQATLFYPPNFDAEKKYPVVLWIYEKQQDNTNKYLSPTFKNRRGFNARLLLESGYMVLMPDINIDARGPALSALHCVNNVLDELSKVHQVDMGKLALMGHSFGGYETNFIATHSKRFAAFISGAGASDIIHHAFSFNYNFKSPDYYRVENGQYNMKDDFLKDKQKYIDNNPLYFALQVNAPVLLWTGLEDKNVDSEESRTFFNALRKYRKTVVALFYKDETHTLTKFDAQKDYTLRMLDWYEYFLKDRKDIPWINKQVKDAL